MINIYGITRKKLEKKLIDMGEKRFKATQIFEWVYEKRVTSFLSMTNLKKELIENLSNDFDFSMIKIIKKQEDKGVKKYLFELSDKTLIEGVLMEHNYGLSVCISSQVGCSLGCLFCESGRTPKIRNLEAHEMTQQIILIQNDIKKRISNVVIMGIGEPLDNYENVMDFIKIINDDKGLKIGARHITLSTCGLVREIEKLSKENLQINLAVSLHAANNILRDMLMPINKVYNIDKLMEAIKAYIESTNRRITIEYVMLELVNDNESDAEELSVLLKGLNVYVNLIPYNETKVSGFKKSKKERVLKFYDILKKNKINVTIRREYGSNIDAACGQLRTRGEI